MSGDRSLSRRDFLRLRRTERGKVLDVSCRTMFMRCTDAAIVQEPVDVWEPWMGEPPAVIARPTVDAILSSLEEDLRDVQVLRLHEPSWLENLPDAPRVHAALDAFHARGGIVERVFETE